MDLPEYIIKQCKNQVKSLDLCEYSVTSLCKETCNAYQRMKQGIKHRAKIGIERFTDRYPFYELGIGAMVNVPEGLKS